MDDLISRQDAIKILDSAWVDGTEYEGYLHEEFEKLPSAQPQRTGKWIAQKGGGYCCSECGSYSLDEVDGAFIHVSARTRYCHNCGTRMEKEE